MALCTCRSSFRKQAQIALRKNCAREEITGCTLYWPGNIEVHHATNSNFKESQFTNCCHQDNTLHTIKLLHVEHADEPNVFKRFLIAVSVLAIYYFMFTRGDSVKQG